MTRDLALTLTHPRYHIDKEYEVGLAPPFNRADRPKLLRGFRIEGGFAKMEEVVVVSGKALRIVSASRNQTTDPI
jgi:16S rRNA U516 pseudouridylate synthase RsuA-like enzyme